MDSVSRLGGTCGIPDIGLAPGEALWAGQALCFVRWLNELENTIGFSGCENCSKGSGVTLLLGDPRIDLLCLKGPAHPCWGCNTPLGFFQQPPGGKGPRNSKTLSTNLIQHLSPACSIFQSPLLESFCKRQSLPGVGVCGTVTGKARHYAKGSQLCTEWACNRGQVPCAAQAEV